MDLADLQKRLSEEQQARRAAERLLVSRNKELSVAKVELQQLKAVHAVHADLILPVDQALARENLKVRSEVAQAMDRLWHAVNTIIDGFAIFDPDHRLVLCNPAYTSLFRDPSQVKPGMRLAALLDLILSERIVDLEDQSDDDWKRMMLHRWRQDPIKSRNFRLRNGMHIRIVDRHSSNGDIVSMVMNVTNTILREEELRDARLAAEAASRAKTAFLANMSHEIRTPMNGVVGMADLLAETALSEDQRLFVNTIKSSGDALLVILNDILNYSKIEAGKLDLHTAPFDPEALVQEVMLLLDPMAREKGLEMRLLTDADLPGHVVGDSGRVRQIVTNLVGNAIKFTDKGHVSVTLRALADPPGIRITVSDTGIGMSAAQAERVFDEFTQADASTRRRHDGTGLGLAITRRLSELMGGQISVVTAPGQGSHFSVTLPLSPVGDDPPWPSDAPALALLIGPQGPLEQIDLLLQSWGSDTEMQPDPQAALDWLGQGAEPDLIAVSVGDEGTLAQLLDLAPQAQRLALVAGPAQARSDWPTLGIPVSRLELISILENAGSGTGMAQPAPVAIPPSPSDGRLSILAAEDNRTNRLVFENMLRDLPVRLRFAENGQEAVDHYRGQRPDLIFMDISMPVMDGHMATRQIRAIEAAQGLAPVPIIALTAHVLAEFQDNAATSGIDDWLTKPLRKADLMGKLLPFLPAPGGD